MRDMESPAERLGGQAGGGGPSARLQELLIQAANLSGSEARVLAALLGLRTATLKQLSEAADIPTRSNLYPVLDSLSAKGLCQRLPGKYAVWECPEPEEVLDRLQRVEEARLDAARETAGRSFEEARKMLARPSSDTQDPPIILDNATRSGVIYRQAMASLDGEVLVLNRGPYGGDVTPDPTVLEALARGVRARALYVADELDAPDGEVRRCADAYGEAGVEQRVVDHLPVSMALIGAKTALLSLHDGDVKAAVPDHAATVCHDGMVELLSEAFERIWDRASPYQPADPSRADLRVVDTDAVADPDD